MIVSSDKLTNFEQVLDNGSVGDYILLSMRKQRKNNVLCDAIVKCSDKEFSVHRSMLYAYSLYCRELFSGSFAPETQNGITVIDLDCFSENTVRVFLDILYGEISEPIVNIEVEELLKLADFLHADLDIPIVTSMLREFIGISNCLELYKLAGSYNFCKLQTIVLTFISDHLKVISTTEHWMSMDEETLFSILKHPLIRCRTDTLVGGALKSYYSRKSPPKVLMGIDPDVKCNCESSVWFPGEQEDIMQRKHVTPWRIIIELFFVFCEELYYVIGLDTKQISRYSVHHKSFVPGKMINGKLPEMTSICAITSDDKLIIMFIHKNENRRSFSLTEVPVKDGQIESGVPSFTKQISTTFEVKKLNTVWDPSSKRIFFFDELTVHIFSMDSHEFTKNTVSLSNISCDSNMLPVVYHTEFRGSMY